MYLRDCIASGNQLKIAHLPANTKDPSRPRSSTGTHVASSLLIAGYIGPWKTQKNGLSVKQCGFVYR